MLAMTEGSAQRLVVELSLPEAMTVSAALRQYEPYWSPRASPSAVAEQLAEIRQQITDVIAKLRLAAAAGCD